MRGANGHGNLNATTRGHSPTRSRCFPLAKLATVVAKLCPIWNVEITQRSMRLPDFPAVLKCPAIFSSRLIEMSRGPIPFGQRARNAQPFGAGHRFLQLVEKQASVLFPYPFRNFLFR